MVVVGLDFVNVGVLVAVYGEKGVSLLDVFHHLDLCRSAGFGQLGFISFLGGFCTCYSFLALAAGENNRLLLNTEHIYLPRVATKDEAGVIFEVQINHRKDFFVSKRSQTRRRNRRDELEVVHDIPKVNAAIKSSCYQSLLITGEK